MKERLRLGLVTLAALGPACSTVFGDFTISRANGAGGAAGTGGERSVSHSSSSSGSQSPSSSSSGTPASSSSSAQSSSAQSSSSSGAGGAGGTGGHGTGGLAGTGGAAGCGGAMIRCNGACVDTTTSQTNCGRCGHDCLRGMCLDSACQAWTVATNANIATPGSTVIYVENQLDADGTWVVWIDNAGRVNMTQANGSGADSTAWTVVSQLALLGVGPVIRNGTVYFIGADGVSLYAATLGQVSSSVVATLPTGYSASALTLDAAGTEAIISSPSPSGGGYQLLHCTLTGATCTTFGGTLLSQLQELHLTPAYLFYAGGRVDLVQGSQTGCAAGALAIALDSENIYWAAGTSNPTVYGEPQNFDGGGGSVLSTSNIPIFSLATDGTNLYYGLTDADGNAGFYAAPVGGTTTPTLLYTSQSFSIYGTSEAYAAAAGGAVYWADIGFASPTPASTIVGIVPP